MNATIAILLLGLAPAASDEGVPKVKPLSAEDAAKGYLRLFDGATTFGWTIGGDARVEKGVLILGGPKKTTAKFNTGFSHFVVEGDLAGNAWLFATAGGLDSDRLNLPGEGERTKLTLRTIAGEGHPRLDGESEAGENDGWVVDQAELHHDGKHPVFLNFEIPAGKQLKIRSMRLRPTGLKDLLNGKDLKGWSVSKGKGTKSTFQVTKEGWLHLQNGPGDLQSKEEFADFVLQLDCRSNGKELNSGVFFRCIPGEYQRGYEAQILNRFRDTLQAYEVAEYDPKTHKLKGKIKVKSPARDYGTGAIYNRMPVRVGMSKDKEWFTMTIVANGRHVATWVNGIQVVDWTDNRPANDNPREGYRAKKGPLSLQGHDPTTDLHFRNFRIAELKKR
jgi:hypothetical protein